MTSSDSDQWYRGMNMSLDPIDLKEVSCASLTCAGRPDESGRVRGTQTFWVPAHEEGPFYCGPVCREQAATERLLEGGQDVETAQRDVEGTS